MDMYTVKVVSTIVSVLVFVSSSTLVLVRQNKQDGDGYPEVQLPETNKPEVKPSLGDLFYYKSELYEYSKKFGRELELAKTQRKKECGTYIKFSSVDCDICILFVSGLKALVEKGSTQDDVAKFATKACKDLKIEDDRVCTAITQEYKVHIKFPMYYL